MIKYIPFLLILLVLTSCSTPVEELSTEQKAQELMEHPFWPEIHHIAAEEVNRKEKILGVPNTEFVYVPHHHEQGVWLVGAVELHPLEENEILRIVFLTISDDGEVLSYQRHFERD